MKKLYRSRENKIIAGVCGGLGKYFDRDPIIIRLLWIFLTLVSFGVGVLAYLFAWILIPLEPVKRKREKPKRSGRPKKKRRAKSR